MCPDRQLLSVYLDGELPSPWKEKMEGHLASCSRCRETLGAWRKLSAFLEETPDPGEARDRVWERLSASAAQTAGRARVAMWRRNVPLPFTAALAAAAAVLAIVFTTILVKGPENIPSIVESPLAAGIDMNVQGIVPVSDMNSVLRYLESTDNGDIMIIRLPESRRFVNAGEPKIIKADYGSKSQR
jgi:predicted anti-sigma-YlaC factor YlaD